LGSAVAVSIVVHGMAIAIAVLGFGRQVPAAEDPAAITVFVPPAPPAAAAVEEKPVEPPKPEPPPPPTPDYTLPPPEEALAAPDFKAPPPPPPAPPRPVPPKPPIAAAPRPAPSAPTARQQQVAPVDSAAPPAAPSIVPGWNVQLAGWLAAHKRYPSAARSRGEEGEVLVHFTVESDGHVIDVAIAQSSGHADLDAAALAMLQGATVPPPGAAATRTVRIHFRLDD
jgi:protein TonB